MASPSLYSIACLLCSLALVPACESDKSPQQRVEDGARSAAGAIGKAPIVGGPGEVDHHDDDDNHPGGPPEEIKPPPVEGAAGCIIADEDDEPPPEDDDDDSRTPPVVNLPGGGVIEDREHGRESARPRAAAAGSPAGASPSASPQPVAGGATRSASRGGNNRPNVNGAQQLSWAEMCAERMTSDKCNDTCGARDMTWKQNEGNEGTCFSASAAGVQCGCMCV